MLSVFIYALTLILVKPAEGQIINTIAGTGTAGYAGDGGLATSANFFYPRSMAFDIYGNMYIADLYNHRIRKINTLGIVTTIAGTGVAGYYGDGGAATLAEISYPAGIAIDAAGNIYFSENGSQVIRKVNTLGIISTYAGNGLLGYSGDGGLATSATMRYPDGIALDASGNLYFCDFLNHCVRMVNTSGIISTITGTGAAGFSGDGGLASLAQVNGPEGIDVDAAGNIYIGDFGNSVIRKINTSGIITTVAGNNTLGYSGDGGPATSAQLNNPNGVYVDVLGNLFIADFRNHCVRKVNTSGIISTYAGNGIAGFSGDGGVSSLSQLNYPTGIIVDAYGDVFIADYGNQRIRKVSVPPCDANAGSNVTICKFGSVNLNASGGVTYSWSPTTGLSNPNIANPIASPLSTTNYTVTVSNGQGICYSNVIVKVVKKPIATITGPSTICGSTNICLQANIVTGATYQWILNGVNIPLATSSTYCTNQPGNYKVLVTYASGCFKKSAAKIVVVDDCDCIDNLVDNGDFANGIVNPGFVTAMPPASVNNWTMVSGDPDIYSSMGANDWGYFEMYGNDVYGEMIQQTLSTPFVNGNNYLVTYKAKYVGSGVNAPLYVNFRFTATNSASYICGAGCSVMNISPAISSPVWTTYSFIWTAPAGYSILEINPQNGALGLLSDDISYGQIDNICITPYCATWPEIPCEKQGSLNPISVVYPNPVINELTVYSELDHGQIIITDILGNQVYEADLNNNYTTISTAALMTGIYFIKIFTETKSETIKFVKVDN